jgi:hypothetical protein
MITHLALQVDGEIVGGWTLHISGKDIIAIKSGDPTDNNPTASPVRWFSNDIQIGGVTYRIIAKVSEGNYVVTPASGDDYLEA